MIIPASNKERIITPIISLLSAISIFSICKSGIEEIAIFSAGTDGAFITAGVLFPGGVAGVTIEGITLPLAEPVISISFAGTSKSMYFFSAVLKYGILIDGIVALPVIFGIKAISKVFSA